MTESLAERRSRAEQLRTELSGLRTEHAHKAADVVNNAASVALDAEIAELEKQVAIQREVNNTGGSVIDAMEAMAAAAALEEGNAAKVPVEAKSAEEPARIEDEKPSAAPSVLGLNVVPKNGGAE